MHEEDVPDVLRGARGGEQEVEREEKLKKRERGFTVFPFFSTPPSAFFLALSLRSPFSSSFCLKGERLRESECGFSFIIEFVFLLLEGGGEERDTFFVFFVHHLK